MMVIDFMYVEAESRVRLACLDLTIVLYSPVEDNDQCLHTVCVLIEDFAAAKVV